MDPQILDVEGAPDPTTTAMAGGGCYLCRTPPGVRQSRWISTAVWIEAEGQLWICEPCLIELADLAGYTTPAKTTKLQAELRSARSMIRTLKKENDALHRAIEAFRIVSGDPDVSKSDAAWSGTK